MSDFKHRIEAALAELARTDIPQVIRDLSELDDPNQIDFALADLRKKLAYVDSWIFDRFGETRS